ncbi:DUF4349 domain-containing protein [Agromyces humatus]|uniref:DUF4349 domain-containing protein n=1 Tax=Agromyces humatus TaxID=279573 RepID=A0ABP4X727_9MICO|nr:DUF4349 domain-containing protein [Agromyces humatus]
MNPVHLRRRAPAAAAAALIALLLAGCSMGSGGSTAPGVGTTTEVAPAPGAAQDQAVEEASGGAGQPEALVPDRSVITTGSISITVDDPIASAEDVADLAGRAGGRVESRTETPGTETQQPSAQLVLRIPGDELDGVVERLRELGTVTSVSMNASDVTQQRQDLDARIEALTASVDRLQQLLSTATSITDLIAIESELTTRQAELDSLTQQRDYLVDQVDFSTVTVELVTAAAAPDPRPDDFWSGVLAGWAALTAFASWLGVAFGVMLPWLVALLVVAAIAALVVGLATRGRRRAPALPQQDPRA